MKKKLPFIKTISPSNLIKFKLTRFTLLILLFSFSTNGFTATNTWIATSGTGLWQTNANWSLGHKPVAAEPVIIAALNGVVATVPCICNTAVDEYCASLTIDAGASIYTWNNTARFLWISGSLVVNGKLSAFKGPGAKTSTNTLSLNFNPVLYGVGTVSVGVTGDATDGEIEIWTDVTPASYSLATDAKFHGFYLGYGAFDMNGKNLTVWQFWCSKIAGITSTTGPFKVGTGLLKICAPTIAGFTTVAISTNTANGIPLLLWSNANGGIVEYDATGATETQWIGTFYSQVTGTSLNYIGNQTVYPVAYNKLMIKTISPYTVSLGDGTATTLAIGGDLEMLNPSTAGGITQTNTSTANVTVGGNIYIGATSTTNPSGNSLTLNATRRIYRASGTGTITMGNNTAHAINISYLDVLASSDECFTGFGTPTFYGSVSYNGAGNQEIIPATFYNLTLATSGAKTALGNNSITNNFTNNVAGTAGFAAGSNTVSFTGSNNQLINGTATATTFNNLTINNSSGGVTLSTYYIDVAASLALTSGIVYSGATANTAPYLRIKNGGSVSPTGGKSTSYIDGYVRKTGFTAGSQFNFPTGNGTYWRRIGANIQTTSTTDEFEARYIRSPYSNTTSMAASPTPILANVSTIEHWMLSRTAGAPNAAVTLFWEDAAASAISSCAAPTTGDLCVGRFNGSAWENWNTTGGAVTGTCSGTSAGSITSQNYVTSFSPFTFGSKGGNVLPVKLLSFDAQSIKNKEVELTWITTTEINNDYFTIERSTDAINWKEVITKNGAGNSSNSISYEVVDSSPSLREGRGGVFYYRLKQTDFNGEFSYSDIRMVKLNGSNEINFYPNPANDELAINFAGISGKTLAVSIVNSLGQLVFNQLFDVKENLNTEKINLKTLSEGVYLISFKTESTFESNKLIIRR